MGGGRKEGGTVEKRVGKGRRGRQHGGLDDARSGRLLLFNRPEVSPEASSREGSMFRERQSFPRVFRRFDDDGSPLVLGVNIVAVIIATAATAAAEIIAAVPLLGMSILVRFLFRRR